MRSSLALLLITVCAAPSWAESKTCDELSNSVSPPSAEKVRVVFINHSRNTRSLYWLDFEGHRKLYTRLKPGETYDVDSFVGHLWVFLDNRNRCVRGYAVHGAAEVVISH